MENHLSSAEDLEKFFQSKADNSTKTLRIPCKKCNRTFKIKIDKSLVNEVEHFPFPLVLMHSANEDDKKKIHTMIAYIDKQLKCRHVDFLGGKRIFITPYIVYNPSLLQIYCNK